MKQRLFALVGGMMLHVSLVYGQFNLGVGYSGSLAKVDQFNLIVDQFNEKKPWLSKDLGHLNYLSGFYTSIRQKASIFTIEPGIRVDFATLRSNGVDPSVNTSFFQNIFLRNTSLELGFGIQTKVIGAGVSLNRNNFVLSHQVTGLSAKDNVIKQNGWGGQVYLNIEMPGEKSRLNFRPFIKTTWFDINYDNLEETLLGAQDPGSDRNEQPFLNYGIMLIFYNGIK